MKGDARHEGGQGPSPVDWERVSHVDTARLDLDEARAEVLRRMTVPVAALILTTALAVGCLLALVGLDVAGMVGGNAFDLFLVEASYNGITALFLCFPLLVLALSRPVVKEKRREVVDWLLTAQRKEAREYVAEVEGADGLVWRFGAGAWPEDDRPGDRPRARPRDPHLPVRVGEKADVESGGRYDDEVRHMLDASRRGSGDEIDPELYGEYVRVLQEQMLRERMFQEQGRAWLAAQPVRETSEPFREGGGGADDDGFAPRDSAS